MKLLSKFLTQYDKQDASQIKQQSLAHNANYRPGKIELQSFLRVRPLFLSEQIRNPQSSIEVLDRESVIFKHEHQQGLKSLTKDKLYRCTLALPPGSKTNSIFQQGAVELVNDFFRGHNQAIFVIGGKEAGKTHTFVGNVVDPGLCFLLPRTIFSQKDRLYPNSKIYLSCFSFGNGFNDLLTYTRENLEHKNTHFGSYLPGLTQVECPDLLTYLSYLKMILVAEGKRDINRDFSQSFTLFNTQLEKEIFIIKLSVVNLVQEKTDSGSVAKENLADLFLVDTESYESHDKINLKGVNNAMLAFNNCIRSLYEVNMNHKEDHYIPYEQSKFTSFFREYLGGKSKTFIIGTVSPYVGHIEYSMRTVREVQWACKSKSTEQRNSNMIGQNNLLSHEVQYLKVMHNDSLLISQEIQTFIKRKDLIEEEEKIKYIEVLSKIFKKCYYINRVCNEKQKRIFQQLDLLQELQSEMIGLQNGVIQEHVRQIEIKEFFLVKILPVMFNIVYSKIHRIQQLIIKKIKQLKDDCNVMNEIRKDFRDYIEKEVKNNSQIKQIHQAPLQSFAKTLIDHSNWSQFNFFKTFNDPIKSKLTHNKLKVEKTFEANFKRIFKSLEIDDEDQFEDKAFAYASIKFIDETVLKNKRKSLLRKSRGSVRIPSLNRILNSQEEGDQQKINNSSQRRISSIFDLPSSLMLRMNQRNSDKVYLINQENNEYLEVSDENNSDEENNQQQDKSEIGATYYDEEDPNKLYSKKKNIHQQSPERADDKGIIRFNPPSLQIKANRSEISINRKFFTENNSDDIKEQQFNTEQYSFIKPFRPGIARNDQIYPKQEVNSNQSRFNNDQITEQKQLDENESKKNDSSNQLQKMLHSYKYSDICSTSKSSSSGDQNSFQNSADSQRIKNQQSKISSTNIFHHSLNRANSFQLAQQKLSQQYEQLFFQDLKIESQFNKKMVLNINLFKSDLEKYHPPTSISKIFLRNGQNASLTHSLDDKGLNHSNMLCRKQKNLLGNSDILEQLQNPINLGFEKNTSAQNKISHHMNMKNSLSKKLLLEVADLIQKGFSPLKSKYDSQTATKKKSLYIDSIEALIQADNNQKQSTNSLKKNLPSHYHSAQKMNKVNDSLLSKSVSIKKKQSDNKHSNRASKHDEVIFENNLDENYLNQEDNVIYQQQQTPDQTPSYSESNYGGYLSSMVNA